MGGDFRPPGNYLNIITTLYDQGIYANLETWGFKKEIKYRTMEEALNIWKLNLMNYVPITEEIDEKLRQYYQSKMNPDGTYTFNINDGFSCMIWWKV